MKIEIDNINNSFIRIVGEPAIIQQLSDRYTFEAPGHQYSPLFKKKIWDGKIRLLDMKTQTVYAGLREDIHSFCRENNIDVVDHTAAKQKVELSSVVEFIDDLNLPHDKKPRDYQLRALFNAINNERSISILPTGSGKSLLIYMLAKYFDGNVLIVVPTTTLVHQLASDMQQYNCDEKLITKIYGGQPKTPNKITISTWQSLVKQPRAWFDDFDVLIGDEVHLFTAKSLTSIVSKMWNCSYRFGVTGSLDGAKCNHLSLTGLFGPIEQIITTKKLIDRGDLADVLIKILILEHPADIRALMENQEYFDEMKYIIGCEKRNKIIKNLALSCKGNTLVMYHYVDKHGQILYDMISDAVDSDRKVFFIHGGIDGDDRDKIRAIVEKENDAIIVASRKTFSTGINIVNLSNIISASPLKSRITNIQSIGRGLRRSQEKTQCTFFDIADDLSTKKWINYTLNHLKKRIEIYQSEQFHYKQYRIKL